MQGPPRAIWCPVSHRAASVEAGGLRWGDTRVKGVSEHLSLLLMQLYELDGDPRRKEFLDDLFSFMQKRGESPAACPPCAPVHILLLPEIFLLGHTTMTSCHDLLERFLQKVTPGSYVTHVTYIHK